MSWKSTFTCTDSARAHSAVNYKTAATTTVRVDDVMGGPCKEGGLVRAVTALGLTGIPFTQLLCLRTYMCTSPACSH